MNHLFDENSKSSSNSSGNSIANPLILRWPSLVFLILVLLTAPGWALADEPAQEESEDEAPNDAEVVEMASTALGSGPMGLPGVAEPDTVRTNIWLTEALMSELVASTARVLPAPPAALQLVQNGTKPEDGLYKSALVRVLGGLGYEIYTEDEDPARQAAVDFIYSFSVQGVELEYPEVGRTLGLWRRWVDRQLKVTVRVDVVMANSGRVLLSERIQRLFNDRVSADQFDIVDSDLYDFTSAETSESGWKSRMEEIVVLGTLVGLVAVYFSNTGD